MSSLGFTLTADRVTPASQSISPVVPGQVIGDRYVIGSVIGEGGMGIVCAATHLGLGTPVAVKLIRADLKHDPESVQRFLNEARTAASLKGDHIARVYDMGQLDSGEPYLVMEQLDGIGLDAFIKERGPLSQEEAVDIVLQACEGLAEAHAVQLVHRDIKPANLFLARRPDGRFGLKILDFGISKRLLDSAQRGLTDPGRSLGSPSYMSPEQMINASLVDQRADVWSLGVLLFELLTKECPFNGESVPQICAGVLTAEAPVPSQLRPDIDTGLDAVILRCLEKDPERRYGNVAALAESIRPFGSRSAHDSELASAETLSVESAGPKPERPLAFGSLAPTSSAASGLKSRFALTTIGVVFFGLGALLIGLGWPYLTHQHGLPTRLTLPWDPKLGAGPLVDLGLEGHAVRTPVLLQAFSAAAVPNTVSRSATRLAESIPAWGPIREEIRQRAARAEDWQRDQDAVQLDTLADDAGVQPVQPDQNEEFSQ